MKIYLAHKYEKQAEGLAVQKKLEALGFEVLNPFGSNVNLELEAAKQIKENNGYIDDDTCDALVLSDYALIDEAKAVFAIISPNAIGTVSEITYASRKGYPVISYVDYAIPYRHPFLVYHSLLCKDQTEALNAAQNLIGVSA